MRCETIETQLHFANNKTMVKYELANEMFNCCIHLILWNNDLLIEDNYLYTLITSVIPLVINYKLNQFEVKSKSYLKMIKVPNNS